MLNVSLLHGWLPVVINLLGVAGLAWLICRRSVRHVLVYVPVAMVISAGLVLAARWYIESVWKGFPEPVPGIVYFWSAVSVFGIVAAVVRILGGRGAWSRVVSVIAATLVVTLGLFHINAHFGEYPTVRVLLGKDQVSTVDPATLTKGDSVPLRSWKKPPDLPADGKTMTVRIPAVASGFSARDAEVYLPPAYFATPRPALPVLILISGQPGSPSDWLTSVRMVDTLDAFATQHNGVTPIVVVPDGTGSETGNPLCLDSRLGNAATYLTTDVPNWVKANLDVDQNSAKWAVGGLSYGGTCALQIATNHPDRFPTFLDMSGQLEPTLGDRRSTVAAAFGGDEQAFTKVNPMDLMQRQRYPGLTGFFVVGADDGEYRPGLEKVYAAAQASGMRVQFRTVPGGHSFQTWASGFAVTLPQLAAQLGITG